MGLVHRPFGADTPKGGNLQDPKRRFEGACTSEQMAIRHFSATFIAVEQTLCGRAKL